jgi:hypothetical protein
MELAQFDDNLALLFLDEHRLEFAKQRNLQALNLLAELAMPAYSEALKSGSPTIAQKALGNLLRVLPELSDQDRSRLRKSHDALQNQLQKRRPGH